MGHFLVSFDGCPGFKIHEHTSDDIRTYTLSKLNHASPRSTEISPIENSRRDKLERLAHQVSEKAHGVFIWVRIVVEEFSKGVRERVPFVVLEEKLSNMPEELKDLYEHTLERIEIEHTEEAYIMLQIALCAVSPLKLQTFVNATSYTLWSIAPLLDDEAEDDMRQRVISRSGGLLEVSRGVTSFGNSKRLSSKHLTDSEQSLRESKPQFFVQFLHQTVKEFIQGRSDNFGLKRNKSGGCGFQYLLDVSIRCWDAWADDVGLDVFEYARLFRSTGALSDGYLEMVLPLLLCKHPDSDSRLDWWMLETAFKDKRSDIISAIYSLRKLHAALLGLSLAAGLFDFVRTYYKLIADRELYKDSALLLMATIGPQTSSKQVPRREMLSVIFELGIFPDFLCYTTEPYIGSHFTPLTGLLTYKRDFIQGETERVSAIECLLEAGANPNIRSSILSIFPTLLSKHPERIFLKCIKQESAVVVRLFGKYGGTIPINWLLTQTMLWRNLRRQSDVMKEVIAIMERKDPKFRHEMYKLYEGGRKTSDANITDMNISALAAFGALTALGHGASWVFRRHLTAKERWRFAINRTMWVRRHRLHGRDRRQMKFEDVVYWGNGGACWTFDVTC